MNIFNANVIGELFGKAEESPRKRAHMAIHESFDEPVQRVLVALKKGTYVPPHFHSGSVPWELMCVIEGQVKVIIFNENHSVKSVHTLGEGQDAKLVQFGESEIHTLVSFSEFSNILEIKPGPYDPTSASNIVEGFPQESDNSSATIVRWLEMALPGDQFENFE